MHVAKLALAGLLFSWSSSAASQPHQADESESLREAIIRADSLRYVAYNGEDVDGFTSFLADDVEVFHDRFSAMQGRQAVRSSLASVFERPGRVRRELVPGSLEVYPLADSAAVQLSDNHFYEVAPDGSERLARIAKLIVFWRFAEGQWTAFKLASFDHRPAASER